MADPILEDIEMDATYVRPNMHKIPQDQFLYMVRRIVSLRVREGLTYREIDEALPGLPRKAAKIMSGHRAKFLVAVHGL